MGVITFDTLKYTKQLKEAGIPRNQAEAQANAYRQSLNEVMEDVASKSDVASLKKDADVYKSDISSLKTDMMIVKKDLAVLKWMVGFIMIAVIVPLLKGLL